MYFMPQKEAPATGSLHGATAIRDEHLNRRVCHIGIFVSDSQSKQNVCSKPVPFGTFGGVCGIETLGLESVRSSPGVASGRRRERTFHQASQGATGPWSASDAGVWRIAWHIRPLSEDRHWSKSAVETGQRGTALATITPSPCYSPSVCKAVENCPVHWHPAGIMACTGHMRNR